MVGIVSLLDDVTTARGHATINWSAPSSTLGGGAASSIGWKRVSRTLGGRDSSVMARLIAFLSCFLLCSSCTLGDGGGSMPCTSTSPLLFAACLKMLWRRLRAWMSSSHMLFGAYFRRACDIRLAADMMTSAGEIVGLVMYLCLKNTVADTLVAFVSLFHRFQQR